MDLPNQIGRIRRRVSPIIILDLFGGEIVSNVLFRQSYLFFLTPILTCESCRSATRNELLTVVKEAAGLGQFGLQRWTILRGKA